jgi:hypothetical protein
MWILVHINAVDLRLFTGEQVPVFAENLMKFHAIPEGLRKTDCRPSEEGHALVEESVPPFNRASAIMPLLPDNRYLQP